MASIEECVKEFCEENEQEEDEIIALNLDARAHAPTVKGLDGCTELRELSMNKCGIKSLEDFPCLPNLEKLVMSDNLVTDGLEHLVSAGCDILEELDLSGNKIATFEALKPLAGMKSLKVLDLFQCPVTALEGYREKVFEMLDHLLYLDSADSNGVERMDDDDEDDPDEEGEGDDFDEDSDDEGDEDNPIAIGSGEEEEDFDEEGDEDDDDDEGEDDDDDDDEGPVGDVGDEEGSEEEGSEEEEADLGTAALLRQPTEEDDEGDDFDEEDADEEDDEEDLEDDEDAEDEGGPSKRARIAEEDEEDEEED